MTDYNDSNHTLRSPRSYQEATGKRLYRSDFADEFTRPRGRDALLWLSVVVVLSVVGYIFIPS